MKSMKIYSVLVIFFICSASLIAALPSQNEDTELVASTNQTSQRGQKSAAMIDVVACATADWVKCGISLGQFVFSMLTWQNGGQIPVLGRTCTISVRGRISSWKWVWDGRLRCPFGQEGVSKGWKSAKGAAEHATMEFFRINAALIQSMQG